MSGTNFNQRNQIVNVENRLDGGNPLNLPLYNLNNPT